MAVTGKATHVEDIFKIRSVTAPKIGAFGITALVTRLDEEKNDYFTHLYKMHEDGATQLTYKEERLSNIRHSADGRWILFIAKADDKQQVFLLAASGGERMQLTNEKEGVSNAEFSKGSGRVFYQSVHRPGGKADDTAEADKKPEPVVIDRMKYKADGTGLLEEKYANIKSISISSKTVDTLLEGEENHTLLETFDDGIVYATDRSEDRDFNFNERLFIRRGKEDMEIPTQEGGVMQVEASPDGQRLLTVEMGREYENATHASLYLYDMKTGDKLHVTAGLDRPVGDHLVADTQQSVETDVAKWISNERFLFLVSDHGSVNLYEGNVDGDTKPVLEGRHHIHGMDVGPDFAALTIAKHTSPGELYRYDYATGALEQLSRINTDYTEATLIIEPEDIVYTSFDGTEVHGWFMPPVGFTPDGAHPMIVNIHGGPHAFYGHSYFHEMQVLAAAGYAVLFVNPRGSHSYSQSFVDAVRGDYGGGDYKDILAGVDFITSRYKWIDADNIGVTGGSYGGFMTNWIVGHTNRFKAAVTQRSISNWISFRGVSDIGYYFTDWQIKAEFNDVDKMWHHSPIRYVDAVDTPLLILHSEQDLRCPIEQGEQLYIALKYRKKPVQFVRFPEADHNLSRTGKPNLRIDRLKRIVNWFNEYMK